MNTLAEAFAKEAAKRKDAEVGVVLCQIVERAMSPFKTGSISLELSEDLSLYDRARTLWITAETLPTYSFRYKFDEWMVHQAYDPNAYLIDSISEPLFDHFRNRPSLPVDDHIVLGEE